MSKEMDKLAQSFVNTMASRMRQETQYHTAKTHLGYVVDAKSLAVEINGKKLNRSSFRVAKNVSVQNLKVNDEVLLQETHGGTMVLVAVMRSDNDSGDNFGKTAPTKFVRKVGDGSTTVFPITHALGTKDIAVHIWGNSTNELYYDKHDSIVATSDNVVTITFSSAPTVNEFRVVIHK